MERHRAAETASLPGQAGRRNRRVRTDPAAPGSRAIATHAKDQPTAEFGILSVYCGAAAKTERDGGHGWVYGAGARVRDDALFVGARWGRARLRLKDKIYYYCVYTDTYHNT